MFIFIFLNRVKDWWFVGIDDSAVVGTALDDLAGFAVHIQKFGHIESGLLEDLHFSDVDIMEGVGRGGGLEDLLTDRVGEELGDNVLDVGSGNLEDTQFSET